MIRTERHLRGEVFSAAQSAQWERTMLGFADRLSGMAGKFIVAFTFGVGVICSQAAHAEKVRVAIPGLSPNSAFFMVALQKGYYSEEKIEIDVVQAGGGTAIPALISGDMQFSASTGSAVSAILKGAKLKVVMVGQDRPGAQIWTSRSNIKSLADLRGQQIGIQSRGDTGEMAVLALLKRNGLPRDYVAFTPMGTGGARLAALKSKALPAVLVNWFEIAELRPSDLAEAHSVVDLYGEVRMPYNGLATSDDMIRNKSDLLHRFVRATLKGVAYTLAFHAESVKLVSEYGKMPLAVTKFDFDKMILSTLPDGIASAELQATEIALRLELLGMALQTALPNSAVFDFTAVQRVSDQLKAAGWKPTP
jgi:NitT/TauT family transport system substrate-binding protein